MGVIKCYNLKPGGDKILVTRQNRKGESSRHKGQSRPDSDGDPYIYTEHFSSLTSVCKNQFHFNSKEALFVKWFWFNVEINQRQKVLKSWVLKRLMGSRAPRPDVAHENQSVPVLMIVVVETRCLETWTFLKSSRLSEYVQLYVDFLLNKSIQKQFAAFYRGFHSVCSSDALMVSPVHVRVLSHISTYFCTH